MKDLDRHISRRNQDILNLADQRAKEEREREVEMDGDHVRLCARFGTETFKGDVVTYKVGCSVLKWQRRENAEERKGWWQDREWWMEDADGNRVAEDGEDPSFPSPAVQAAAAMLWPRKNFPSLTAWLDYVKRWWPKVPAMTAILDQHKPA